MKRIIVQTLLIVSTLAGGASAQDWARKMFKATEHDFGTLAKGAKTEFAFEFENIFEEDIHIAGVRSSCGCTAPTVTKSQLKTWEKSSIVAAFQTATYEGQRSATLTVTIDKPYFAEVQLNVKGFIRRDVVFSPGLVDFGNVDLGSGSNKKINVTYAGRANWQITDVQSANKNLEVDLVEGKRAGGRVTYEMVVHLKPDAPEGYLQDQLIIVTDDPSMPKVPLTVEGNIIPAISVSPSSLFLGALATSGTITKQLVVKGKQPFKILGIKASEEGFEFKPSSEEKKLHIIPVTFTAAATNGKLVATIEIQTDHPGGEKVTCTANATVGESGEVTNAANAVTKGQIADK